jgi:hypothetical protein
MEPAIEQMLQQHEQMVSAQQQDPPGLAVVDASEEVRP